MTTDPRPSRRGFLAGAAAVIATACTGSDDRAGDTTTSTAAATTTTRPEPVGPYPFPLGVASGDPDTTSVVLWVATDQPGEVTAEVALDETFTALAFSGPVEIGEAGTGRIVADGLEAGTGYRYRFWCNGHVTRSARTTTAPAPGDHPDLHLGHLSCQRYSDGYWTALTDLAAEEPDLVVHCGDYIYELDQGAVRPLDHPRPTTLDEYRAIWRRYRSEAPLQAAHAVAPWLMTWDDHEVENNYQGDAAGGGGQADFAARRAAAYQAWWEFTPTRLPAPGDTFTTHRVVDWGGLARFVLLDTRQHRDDQPCPDDLGPRCDASAEVSMLGADQEAWMSSVVRGHRATWTVVVSGTVVHEWRLLPGNQLWNLDQWDGYPTARSRLFADLLAAPDPVVLSGDVHSAWAADLRTDFDGGDFEPVGVEFVTTSVSSAVPSALARAAAFLKVQNNHISYGDADHRGWTSHQVGGDEWTARFRIVEDATVPRLAAREAATRTVRVGDRALLD